MYQFAIFKYQLYMVISLRKTIVYMSIVLVLVRTNIATYRASKQNVFHFVIVEAILNCIVLFKLIFIFQTK